MMSASNITEWGSSIAFYSHKGGVGKTSLLFDTAYHLAMKQNMNVVIIDADTQLSTTFHLLSRGMSTFTDDLFVDALMNECNLTVPVKGHPFPTLYTYMCGSPRQFTMDDLFVVPDTNEKIRLLIGSPLLDSLPTNLSGFLKYPLTFYHLLEEIREAYSDVLILVDMSNHASILNQTILLACDSFVLPTNVQDTSYLHFHLLLHSLPIWRSKHTYLPLHHNVKLLFVILNQYMVESIETMIPSLATKIYQEQIKSLLLSFHQHYPRHALGSDILLVQHYTRDHPSMSFFEIEKSITNEHHVDSRKMRYTQIELTHVAQTILRMMIMYACTREPSTKRLKVDKT